MRSITISLVLALFAQGKDPATTKVGLKVENATLDKVLQTLRTDSGIPIDLDEGAKKEIDLEKEQISLDVQKTNLTDVLKLIFGPRGFDIKVVDKKKVVITVKKK